MAQRFFKRGHGVRKGRVATNAIKGTLFSQFRRPGGQDEAKIDSRRHRSGGEGRPRSNQNEVLVSQSRRLIEAS